MLLRGTNKDFPHTFLLNSQPKKKRGDLITIKNSVDFKLHMSVLDGWSVILACTNKPYTIVGVYALNSKVNFPSSFFKGIFKHNQGNLIVCGVMNSVVDPLLDSTSNKLISHSQYFAKLRPFWCMRCLHASEHDYTYHSSRFYSYSHID